MIKFLKWLFRTRTCKQDGCGFEQPNHLDDKCAICRLHMSH